MGEVVRHEAEFGLQVCVVQQELIADFGRDKDKVVGGVEDDRVWGGDGNRHGQSESFFSEPH